MVDSPAWRSCTLQTLLLFVIGTTLYLVFVARDTDALEARVRSGREPGVAAGPRFLDRKTAAPADAPGADSEPVVVARPGRPSRVEYAGLRVIDPCISRDGDRCRRWALDGFFTGLSALERDSPRVVRVSHLGDSMVASSYINTPLRVQLQERFGDGGTGFVYWARPSRFFIRRGVRQRQSKNWAVRSISSTSIDDGFYGLGGVAFIAGNGERVVISTAKRGHSGDRVSRFEVSYLAQPQGGSFVVSVDGKDEAVIDTRAETSRSAYHVIDVKDGAHQLAVFVRAGAVRGYGVVMERDRGVVLDALGIIGASALALSKIDQPHWAEQLRHRNPDLVIVLLGSNEAVWVPNFRAAHHKYEERYAEILRRIREALPDAGCLAMAPLDQGIKRGGHIVPNPTMPGLVAAQARAAKASGCAFWNTFEYMGGAGSYRKWYRHKWMWTDMTHPTPVGGKRIARALFGALMARYAEYQLRLHRREHAP